MHKLESAARFRFRRAQAHQQLDQRRQALAHGRLLGSSSFCLGQHRLFTILLKQLYSHRLVNFLARRAPHFLQYRFGRIAVIHHVCPLRFTAGFLDPVEETAQGSTVTRVAVHHFIGQWKAICGDHQRSHQLQTIRPSIANVTVLGLGVLFHRPFKVRSCQIVKQHFGFRLKQVGPLLSQPAGRRLKPTKENYHPSVVYRSTPPVPELKPADPFEMPAQQSNEAPPTKLLTFKRYQKPSVHGAVMTS